MPTKLVADVAEGVASGLNVLVTGPSGAGKTTAVLSAVPSDAVWLDGRLANDAGDIVLWLLDRLGAQGIDTERDGLSLIEAGQMIERASLRGHHVVVIDDLPNATVARDLFARLRDRLWSVPAQWVVICPPTIAATLSVPPANAFFSYRVESGQLSLPEMRDLLAVALPTSVADDLVARTPPHGATVRGLRRWALAVAQSPKDGSAGGRGRRCADRDLSGVAGAPGAGHAQPGRIRGAGRALPRLAGLLPARVARAR